MKRRCWLLVAAVGVALGGWTVAVPAAADPCTGPSGGFGGHGGGRCDYPPGPDGSFVRCDTAYVFGLGGTNCYQVPAGTPHM